MATNGVKPSIQLFTNHRCPWAHRAHIVLKELGISYEETIIDLDTPREPWYLKVNPVSYPLTAVAIRSCVTYNIASGALFRLLNTQMDR